MPKYKVKGKKKDGLEKYILRINYTADNGKSKQLTRIAYGTEAADNLETRLNYKLKIEKEIPNKKMTVQELFEEYKQIKTYELRPRTMFNIQQIYDSYILPIYKDFRIDKVTIKDAQDWKIYMEKKNLALSTKKRAFIFFSSIFNYAVRMEYLNKNPLTRVGNFKGILTIKPEMKIYMPEDFNKFITSAKEIAEEKEKLKNDLSEWDYYVFFNIAFYTGLRKGVIHALKWSDIDGSYLTVSRSVIQRIKGDNSETAPKSKSSMRTIQMPLYLINILNEQKRRQQLAHNFNDDFRICNDIRDTTIQRKNKLYSDKAGLSKTIRIHDFRHSHASVLANNNINIQEVARRLGHSRIEITWNTYCHLYPKEEEKAVAILNGLT